MQSLREQVGRSVKSKTKKKVSVQAELGKTISGGRRETYKNIDQGRIICQQHARELVGWHKVPQLRHARGDDELGIDARRVPLQCRPEAGREHRPRDAYEYGAEVLGEHDEARGYGGVLVGHICLDGRNELRPRVSLEH